MFPMVFPCRRGCGARRRGGAWRGRGGWRRSHTRLINRIRVGGLQRLQCQLHFRGRSQSRHPVVIDVVIVTKEVPFFQIRPRGFGRCFRRHHLRIVRHAVLQLSPLDMHPACISFFSQRFLLKGFVKLGKLRHVGHGRLRRRRRRSLWLFLPGVKIYSRRRRILPVQHRCCPAQYSQENQPY